MWSSAAIPARTSRTWLTTAGYVLPADYGAALAPYIDSGNFIFAAKVKKQRGGGGPRADRAAPARDDPGAFAIPFGLAAHSLPPGESLTITAYVLASGTVIPGNYGARAIDRAALIADSETETNYQALYDEAVAEDGGAWVVDASLADFTTANLTWALEHAIAAGRGDGADPDGVTAFIDRVPLSGARLTRIRTTLGAEQLHDMTFTKATLDPVDPALYVVYYRMLAPAAASAHGAVFRSAPSCCPCSCCSAAAAAEPRQCERCSWPPAPRAVSAHDRPERRSCSL